MSINLKVDSWCENCPDFEPNIEKDEISHMFYDDLRCKQYIESIWETYITCKNRSKCLCIKEYLKDESKKGKIQEKDERCPGDFTLESAYYDGVYRK